jgi:hypothetical protein
MLFKELKLMLLKIIGSLIALIGVILIFDSRHLVKKYFNYGEENTATLGMKIFGLVTVVIGGLIIYLN